MTTAALRPMDRLDDDWRVVRRSSTSKEALELLASAEPIVAGLGVLDLGELVDVLRAGGRGSRPPGEAGVDLPAAVVRAMLRSARVHRLVPRAILQALSPGLVSVARRLTWGVGGEWNDGGAFLADVYATAWEIVDDWAGEDRQYAVLDILSAVRCRLRRQLMRHKQRRDRSFSDPHDAVSDALAARPWRRAATDLDELAAAIEEARGREVDARDAAVLYAHRVLGYSLSELSELTGRSRRYLSGRRDRAARALTA